MPQQGAVGSHSVELKQIRSGEVVNATVKPEEYKYFEVKHVKGHLYVYVRELYTSATLRVFASEGTFPTKRNHDYKGRQGNGCLFSKCKQETIIIIIKTTT